MDDTERKLREKYGLTGKFTPGPWVVVRGHEIDEWGVTEVAAPASQSIAQMCWQFDAPLIAAAPQLFADLLAARRALSEAERENAELRKYVLHLSSCTIRTSIAKCDCGLVELLAAIKQEIENAKSA
jgi:hypothetical protein